MSPPPIGLLSTVYWSTIRLLNPEDCRGKSGRKDYFIHLLFLDIEVHCVNIHCLSTRLVCILCRYLVSNVQLVCKLSSDHSVLCGITKVLPYWWDIYWYWSCATAAHSRVRTVVRSSTICKGILSLDIFYDI